MEHSTVFICYAAGVDEVELMQMRGGTQHCYAPCANEVELVQVRGETQYNVHLLCSLFR